MKRFLSIIFLFTILIALFSPGESPGQYANNQYTYYTPSGAVTTTYQTGSAVFYAWARVDSLQSKTSPVFSLGWQPLGTTYPLEIWTKVNTYGYKSTDKARITTYLDVSPDNTNWLLKQDTLTVADSVETWHRFTCNFNNIRTPYYRFVSDGKTTNPDSVQVFFRIFYKRE